MPEDTVLLNRAPVLTLWAAVVAERQGFSWEEALSLGKAVAGLNAQTKGRALGISQLRPGKIGGTVYSFLFSLLLFRISYGFPFAWE